MILDAPELEVYFYSNNLLCVEILGKVWYWIFARVNITQMLMASKIEHGLLQVRQNLLGELTFRIFHVTTKLVNESMVCRYIRR